MRGMGSSALDRLLDPSFARDLDQLTLDEVRTRRGQCQAAEAELSYIRRIVQGRLDILQADLDRRSGGEPHDTAALVAQLPAILGKEARGAGPGRLSDVTVPTDELGLVSDLDAILPPSRFADLGALADGQLDGVATRLAAFEREVSARRRAMHERIDALQDEIVRRYQSGEASVDTLLR